MRLAEFKENLQQSLHSYIKLLQYMQAKYFD